MEMFDIRSEYSAQPSIHQPNRMVGLAIERLRRCKHNRTCLSESSVADQGCGKLRHLPILTKSFKAVYLVDQQAQLERRQRLFGVSNTTIVDYVEKNYNPNSVHVLSAFEFGKSRLGLELVLNACTFDVVTPNSRREMISSAHSNLRKGGMFILIIPRNDQSILKRCNHKNKYWDGHVFSHHAIHTFFRNFRDHGSLMKNVKKAGFELVENMSIYRQICLIFKKSV